VVITTRSQDKYALLFTGPTAVDRFIKDLENVFQTLTEYYNYPPSNITVVLGSTAAAPSVPGATIINITDVGELRVALESFAGMASGPAPGLPGMWKTTLLYFSGGGISEASVSKLVIDGGLGTNNIDPTWLTDRLNRFSDCHVNVVMQQSYAGGFISALTASTLTQWSFTHACNAIQESYGNNTVGSFFTDGWVKGHKLETLPAGTPDAGKYADMLGSVGIGDRLLSLEEAKEFGKQIHDFMGFATFSTPSYNEAGGQQYLGLPAFLIRDGSNGIAWYESPDIYLTHPNHGHLPPGDLYIPDSVGDSPPYNNTINIDTRNVGTHPVRAYSLGIELFKFGLGPISDKHTACDIIPSGGILFPIDLTDIGTSEDKKDTYEWNTPFYEPAVHTCVKAEAKRLCGDVDFTWSVTANDFEGQRNIDEMTIVPPPPMPGPPPFRNIQGYKEHIYGIQNRFDSRRRFLLLFPKEYQKYQNVIELMWFELVSGPFSERVPLDVVDEPVPHIAFLLKAGEKKDILLHVRMRPNFNIEEGVKLQFEIIVEGEWPDKARAMTHVIPPPNYAPIAGFTITIKKGSSTLKGTVLDIGNKPVAEAKVFLRTVNNLQGAVLTTDRRGRFVFLDINPDVYHIWAETEKFRSKDQTIVLLSKKEEEIELHLTKKPPPVGRRVKVILDKIRILDYQDSLIKGEGKVNFTSVVVPDNDESRKQVTRLPARGVYYVVGAPGENEIILGVTIFDGAVKGRSLSISITGKEIDFFDPDDELNRYHRVFTGDPNTWYGQYNPRDEYLDLEDVKDWALWYRIVRG
jgi:hypothetical protein